MSVSESSRKKLLRKTKLELIEELENCVPAPVGEGEFDHLNVSNNFANEGFAVWDSELKLVARSERCTDFW